MSFLEKLKTKPSQFSSSTGASNKKSASQAPLLPIQQLLHNAENLSHDGNDRFFGMQNTTNTCYCNSVLQCLYYSEPFREQLVKFPPRTTYVQRPPNSTASALGNGVQTLNPATTPTAQKPLLSPTSPVSPINKPEDKESNEYKKKMALTAGPLVHVDEAHYADYGMRESLLTGLRDVFETVLAHDSRTGVLDPSKFMETLRRVNEDFRQPIHHDAHEFLNILLNDVADEVDEFTKAKLEEDKKQGLVAHGEDTPTPLSWVKELFGGLVTSEIRCLTCESTSSREETFLDLAVDIEEHSSVTSCLQRYSEEEMMRERDKFHCDKCGGLQEAERRAMIKKSPQILAIHLKRFKYTEEYERMQKLFYKVVYPFYLRLMNTTEDAEQPDRLYELYGAIIHLGTTPAHGHYVSIIKSKYRGWLLFDDENVEPVDRSFVQKYFGGDSRNPACAYVLFYQTTTEEAIMKEQEWGDTLDEAAAFANAATTFAPKSPMTTAITPLATPLVPTLPELNPMAKANGEVRVPLERMETEPIPVTIGEEDGLIPIDTLQVPSAPARPNEQDNNPLEPVVSAIQVDPAPKDNAGSTGLSKMGSLSRFRKGNISLRTKSSSFFKTKDKTEPVENKRESRREPLEEEVLQPSEPLGSPALPQSPEKSNRMSRLSFVRKPALKPG